MSAVQSTIEPGRHRIAIVALGMLVALHSAFGIARVPGDVIVDRWDDVATFRRDGEVRWVMNRARVQGAEVVEQLRRETKPDQVVLLKGLFKGALEFVPAFLWPRLCCRAESVPPGARLHLGRKIAPLVIVGDGAGLRVEKR